MRGKWNSIGGNIPISHTFKKDRKKGGDAAAKQSVRQESGKGSDYKAPTWDAGR